MSDNDTHDGLSERIKELELEVHDAIVRAEEAEVRAASADVLVFPVANGHPGEIDCFSDGHSHYFVPTSSLEAANARVERAALAAETMRRLTAAEARIEELEAERKQTLWWAEGLENQTIDEAVETLAQKARETRDSLEKLEAIHNAPWEDKDDEWTSAIHDAFPTRSGSHKEYAIARRMVGNRHGKGALIDLVNWLLVRAKDEFRDHIEAKLLSAEGRIEHAKRFDRGELNDT